MFKTFILLATVLNPNVAKNESFVIDYNLSESDCFAVWLDLNQSYGLEIAPGVVAPASSLALECEELPPCEFEDSDNCFWNAQENGNGRGRSFLIWNNRVFYSN